MGSYLFFLRIQSNFLLYLLFYMDISKGYTQADHSDSGLYQLANSRLVPVWLQEHLLTKVNYFLPHRMYSILVLVFQVFRHNRWHLIPEKICRPSRTCQHCCTNIIGIFCDFLIYGISNCSKYLFQTIERS